jgi:spore germination protein YaaH
LRYRVWRDGEVVGQTHRLRMSVRVQAGRTHRFTVRAVTARGRLSRCAARIVRNLRHRPPGRPEHLTAGAVTDGSVDLSWSPAAATTGRIVGYRLFRDGAVLRQVDQTSTTVGGLAGAQEYRFTVAAVDSLGYLSEPSDPVTVTTAPPPQTHGDAHVFMLASTGQSFSDLRAHYQQIGTVYPTYFECAPDGTVTGQDDPLVTRWAHLRGIAVMPRLDCQSATRLHLILTDPGVRGAVLGRLSELAQTDGFDGVNIDFEAGAAADRAALTSFVTDLANLLHGQGKRLSVDVSAKTADASTGRSAFYDYAALAAAADTVFVMNWGKHWSTSAPGAIADLPWARSVADYVATMPQKQRFVLGFGLYGMDWPAGGGAAHPATPLEFDDVMNLVDAVGATPITDATAGAPHFSYTDAQGVAHDVWYTDAATVAAQLALARERGLGVGFWRLGREDQRIWDDPLLAPGAT